jgi:hypothetical protein
MRIGIALACAACGSPSIAEPTPDTLTAAADASAGGGAFSGSGVYTFVDGEYGPPSYAGHGLDAAAMRLVIDGQLWPAVDGSVQVDGTQAAEGRHWGERLINGSHALSFRAQTAPDAEIRSAQWITAPVHLDDPDVGPAYDEYGLLKDWFMLFGLPGDLTLQHLALDYDPPAPEHWRIYVINGRTDAAVSAQLVELDDAFNEVPGGMSVPLFQHLPARGVIDGLEVPWPRYRAGLLITLDGQASADRIVLNLAAPNFLDIGDTLSLPMPDGTVMYASVFTEDPANPLALGVQATTRVFGCRDARYKARMLEKYGNCKAGQGLDSTRARGAAPAYVGVRRSSHGLH